MENVSRIMKVPLHSPTFSSITSLRIIKNEIINLITKTQKSTIFNKSNDLASIVVTAVKTRISVRIIVKSLKCEFLRKKASEKKFSITNSYTIIRKKKKVYR